MTRLFGYANRGMELEQLINVTNQMYLAKKWAAVYKRPTPVKILRKKGTRIVDGYAESPSTVDYNGVYKGMALEFEAKSTKEERFPLHNIHEHQIEHLRLCDRLGAVAFCIIEFSAHRAIFYVPAKMIVDAWDKSKTGGRGTKSIPYDDFLYQCEPIKEGRGVPLDYLAVVDKVLESKTA